MLHSLDIFLLELVNTTYHNIILDNLALLLTNMGVIYFWIIIIVLLYFLKDSKARKIAKKMLIILVVTVVVTQIIKYIVMRPRPYTEIHSLILLSLGTDPSFPSGHTTVSTAMAYVLSKEYNKWYILFIPFIVALSRLYLGVHYPSDVLGGFLLGIIISYSFEYYFNFKSFEF